MQILDTKEQNFRLELSKILKHRAGIKADIEERIRDIFSLVEKNHIEAVLDFAKKYDGFVGGEKDLKVSANEFKLAEKRLSSQQSQALRFASQRIKKFHSRQIPTEYLIKERGGYLRERWVPLRSVGLYIPGGTAPLASTVLMSAIPATLAKVKRIVLCTPSKGGEIHPAILYAAKLAGIKEVYKLGGAHAIAAMALAACPIPKVDKIVGPGGVWVSAAKVYAQSKGLCGIDTIAGPSEIVIISDGSDNVEFAIADIKAQLEHGEGGWAFVLATDSVYLGKIQTELSAKGKNLILVKCRNADEMVELANEIAPEHLEIHTRNPERLVSRLTCPSAIYVGAYSPVAAGDYVAGPNHCLPTGGRARFDSPLGVRDFMKRQSVVRLSKNVLKELVLYGAEFAEMEGLNDHSNSLKIRMKD